MKLTVQRILLGALMGTLATAAGRASLFEIFAERMEQCPKFQAYEEHTACCENCRARSHYYIAELCETCHVHHRIVQPCLGHKPALEQK